MPNQFPEHIARDKIDALLTQSGWLIQEKSKINLNAGLSIAEKKYSTEVDDLKDFILCYNPKNRNKRKELLERNESGRSLAKISI